MKFNTYFYIDVVKALNIKKDYEEYMKYICGHLTSISPHNDNWYFRNGFLQVDVSFDDLDEYLEFVEDLVGCKYSSIDNLSGVTLMLSLSTLKEVMTVEKEKLGMDIYG